MKRKFPGNKFFSNVVAAVIAAVCFGSVPSAYATEGRAGSGCASAESLRAIVDQGFNTGQPPVAGISVAVLKPGCGTLLHVQGKRDVVAGKDMTTTTRMHIASLTKPVTGALILKVLTHWAPHDPDAFLNTPVSDFFSTAELQQLTSNCSDSFQINATDRETGALAPTVGLCPDFSAITLWHLIRAHSGLISSEELDVNQNGLTDAQDYVLGNWLRAVGIPTFPPFAEPTTAFGVLDVHNMYRHSTATIGGNAATDFPASLGNTEYELLGIILERITGLSYNSLAQFFITDPLGLDRMILLPTIPSAQVENRRQISRAYMDIKGVPAPLTEDANGGVYPVVQLRGGRPGVDLYELDSWSMDNGAGGAGALAASMKTYATFFGKFIGGGLLSPSMQQFFNEGFVEIGFGPTVTYGFGVQRSDGIPIEGLGTLFQKTGALFGTYCITLHSTGSKATIVACVNQRDIAEGQVPSLVNGVAQELLFATL